MSSRRRLRAAHRQRPVAEGRRLGVLLRRRPADPRPGRLPVRRGRDRRDRRPGQARPAAHPRVPAADPLHAQGRHLRRPRLGGRRRAQPARRLRPDARQRRARPVQADRRRRRLASTAASARRTSPGRSARSSPARSSSSADEYSAEDAHRMGTVNRVVAARRARARRRWSGAGKINGKSPDRAADAEVLAST